MLSQAKTPVDPGTIPSASETEMDPEKGVEGVEVQEHFELVKTHQAVRLESEFVNLGKLQAARTFWKATLFSVMAMVAILLDGFATSIPGNIVSNAGFIQQFGTVHTSKGLALDSRYVSIWGGVGIASALPGQQIGALISDRFGRFWARYAFTVVLIAGAIIEIFSRKWYVWLIAKIVVGLGQGMSQSSTLSYVTELAPTQIRGSLVSVYGIFFGLGQLASSIALNVVNKTDPTNWLKGLYSQFALHGIWLCCLVWLPESPWWYARGHRDVACKKVLLRLNKSVPGYDADREYIAMQEEIVYEESRRRDANATSYREIITFPNLRRTVASCFGFIMLWASGPSVTFTYATWIDFFQQADIPQPFQATVIVYTLLVFSVICSVFYFTEKFGRRSLILFGGTGCAIANLIVAALGLGPKTTVFSNAELAFICIYVLVYGSCIAGTCWGISSELASPRLRAKTTAIAQSAQQAFSLVSSFCNPLMLAQTGPGARNWGVKTLFLYAITGFILVSINFFTLPEIRGRTYAELDEMFEARVPPRKFASHRTGIEQQGTKTHL